jgi:acyl transferase domain-containing protein/NAD(P)-dependent dehydrogenase (short-subunit alcohol dehydrogenase family)/acyl carrier protein
MGGAPKMLNGRSAIKLALMAREVRAQAVPVLQADPIALVGMACRLPGGADTPDRLWQLLCDGVETVGDIPRDRWDSDAWYDPDLAVTGKTITRRGSFLDRIDGFDADYFGITPREADRMDPQQRLFLEVAVEALDDAGLTQPQLARSRTGVFVASYHNDYAQLQYSDRDAIDARTLTGTLHSVLANRLSYLLDLRGPSVSVDTACSASLVAVHLACQSLRLGESDVAIAGGVSLIISPELLVSMSKVGFMAPDGRCKAFDAMADGFGRGEGCSIVVLKRLSDAIAHRDRILAVIRGSAVNQDGHSTLLAAPNGPAQEMLIRDALTLAQLEPERVGFAETHGTGTALGDPIEVEALAATLGREAVGAGPCLLGSVKANLGHLEAAAGATGLIKAVLALRHAAVPGQPNFHTLNPHIRLAGTRLAVPTTLTPWTAGEAPRCASVSSFGVGGTNAFVLLEEAPQLPAAHREIGGDAAQLFPLSAKGPAALGALVAAWIDLLDRTPASLADLGFTATQHRTHYTHRLTVVARSKDELRNRLRDYVNEAAASAAAGGRQAAMMPPKLAFICSGQGPQWYAMGRELLTDEPVFHAIISQCDALLRPLAGWSLLEELTSPKERSRLAHTEVAQPALFAIQVALAGLWKSWGILPDAVVGHSVGEIAALHLAGVLDLEEAVRIVWHRGHIMQQATGLGRMASVSMTEAAARELVQPYGNRLSIGAVNAPDSVVLSGETAALSDALATLTARGVSHRMLPVQYAFHSAQMAPLQEQFVAVLGQVCARHPNIAVYSTVTGGSTVTDGSTVTGGLAENLSFGADYFGRNIREPVRFASAAAAMAADGFSVFVELSPHPVLGHELTACLAGQDVAPTVLASLRRGRAERETMLQACAGLYAAGCDLAWPAVHPTAGAITTLPPYPWQRRRHWIRTRPASAVTRFGATDGHPLLGLRVQVAGTDAQIYQGGSDGAMAWLADHRIFGTLVMPAAAVMEMLSAAASKALGRVHPRVTDFAMLRPVVLPEPGEGQSQWQVVVKPLPDGRAELAWHGAVADADGEMAEWRLVASAVAVPATAEWNAPPRAAITRAVAAEAIYDRFSLLGVAFGPAFRCLSAIELADGMAQARVVLPQECGHGAHQHILHPVLLDAALQLGLLAASTATADGVPAEIFLPIGCDWIEIRQWQGEPLLARARVSRARAATTITADVVLETEQGEAVAMIQGMRFARADRAAFAAADRSCSDLYDIGWKRAPALPKRREGTAPHSCLLFADAGEIADAIAFDIQAAGGNCWTVRAGKAYARTGERSWVIDPTDPDHYRRLWDEAGWSGAKRLLTVLHFWSLDVPTPDGIDAPDPNDGDALGVGSILHLVQHLAKAEPTGACRLQLVTCGAQSVTDSEMLRPRGAGVWGLAGVVALEHPELHVRVIDLDPSAVQPSDRLWSELLDERNTRVALRGAQRWLPRLRHYHRPSQDQAADRDNRPHRVELVRPGSFDGLELRPAARTTVGPGEVRLRVVAAGINFRDVLTVLQMYPGEAPPLGAECAGIVIEAGRAVEGLVVGDRVFGFAPASLGTEAIVPAAFLTRIPPGMPAEDAAGIAIAFATAYYGLHSLAGLRAGERVLIHAAAGGVGLAAVQLAQRCGAEIFATAGSPAKRDMLRGLGVAAVMDSRSVSFADDIIAATGGAGVDVVLNSLAGDFIPAGIRALARGGRFLELGKRGIWSAAAVAKIRPDVRYHVYDLGAEAQADPGLLRPIYDTILLGMADRTLRPLPVEAFALEHVGDAMRHMAQARHIGKVVVRVSPDTQARSVSAGPPFSAAATYWITGGLGGLGLATADWLAQTGARHLVLSGRRPPDDAAQQRIRDLERRGVVVHVFAVDVADEDAMASIANQIQHTMPPLRGVVHAAGVVHDAVLLHLNWNESREVLRGKAHGAWLLHRLTRDLPLDFFVLYSAGAVVLGAPGQGLYPAANAELDALAKFRRRQGLPALSVAWGLWSGIGMAADLAERGQNQWQARGLRAIDPTAGDPTAGDPTAGFAQLSQLLADTAAYGAVIPVDWRQFLSRLPEGGDADFFSDLMATARADKPAPEGREVSLEQRLRRLPSGSRRQELITHVTGRTRLVLGLDDAVPIETIVSLRDMGLDSLMAVELRNTLVRSTGATLPATLLFDYPTIEALAGYLGPLLGIEADTAAAAPAAVTKHATAEAMTIAALSDADAEALLLQELASSDSERAA